MVASFLSFLDGLKTEEKAMALAKYAHEGQMRKLEGKPYIVHPARVAATVKRWLPGNTDAFCAALLHDAVEDSAGKVTVDMIASHINPNVAKIVGLMTHHESEDYFVYVKRLSSNASAAAIKKADLRDNLSTLPKTNVARWDKYTKALAIFGITDIDKFLKS